MTKIHIHEGDGCEFIVDVTGELDADIHKYLCQKAPVGERKMPDGVVKKLCQEHLEQMKRWFDDGDWRD